MKTDRLFWAALALGLLALPASAQVFTMDFDGPGAGGIAKAVPPPALPPGTGDQAFGSAVLGYYDNDPGYERAGRQAWNSTFSPNALAIGSLQDPDGAGNFPTAHSGLYAVGTLDGTSFEFRVAKGLVIAELSFWYDAGGAGSNPGFVLYAGSDMVAAASLDECSNPTQGFCGWKQKVVAPADLANQMITRVSFSGAANKVVFDDIAVTAVPVPEPSTYALMALGLSAFAALRRRRS